MDTAQILEAEGYRFVRRLGAGGSGVVVEAERLGDGQPVAEPRGQRHLAQGSAPGGTGPPK